MDVSVGIDQRDRCPSRSSSSAATAGVELTERAASASPGPGRGSGASDRQPWDESPLAMHGTRADPLAAKGQKGAKATLSVSMRPARYRATRAAFADLSHRLPGCGLVQIPVRRGRLPLRGHARTENGRPDLRAHFVQCPLGTVQEAAGRVRSSPPGSGTRPSKLR